MLIRSGGIFSLLMWLNLARHLPQSFDRLFPLSSATKGTISSYRYFFLGGTPTPPPYGIISCQFAAIASGIQIDSESQIKQPSRLIYILAPGSLVRIGPDLQRAHNGLVSSLIDAYNGKGYNSRHFATRAEWHWNVPRTAYRSCR
jgi:hypothetical protein